MFLKNQYLIGSLSKLYIFGILVDPYVDIDMLARCGLLLYRLIPRYPDSTILITYVSSGP